MAEGGGVMSMQMQRSFTSMQKSFTSVQPEELTHIKNLGWGGFGIVKLQRHTRWGKVAVKQVIEKQVTQERKEAFHKEAGQMLDGLTCQHVVSVMGMVEAPDGGISIVMEYMEYGSLKHFTPLYLVTKETAPNPGDNDVFRSDCWPRRMHMICGMIKGMNFLHTLPEPIFHRDLKLENVFVGPGFRVKIGDLGLAVSRVSRSAQRNKDAAGTVTHLPPEVLNGDVLKATEAWDGYGFGITLFEFVTLTPDNGDDIPWQRFANDKLIMHWVTSNKRPNTDLILAETPDVVVDTMKECWNADYTKRPAFQDLQQRYVTLYEEKYESSIISADIQINGNIARHKQEKAMPSSEPTGTDWTCDSDAINDIHGGLSERKTKQPIQNVSTSDGRHPGNSAGSSSTSEGSTRAPIMVQSQARPPAAFGSQSSSSEVAVAPSEGLAETQVVQPTGSSAQPSQTAAAAASAPEGQVPASASSSPGNETLSPDRSISPLKSMPQHDASGSGGVSAQEGQRMQQQPDWEAARKLVQPTGSSAQASQTAAAAAPEGQVPASASSSPGGEKLSPDRSISPLKSMPQHAATGSGGMSDQEGQRMQQQPDWEAARKLVQPTGSSAQASQTAAVAAAAAAPEGQVPASASFSPDGERVSPDRSISPLKSMPQHAATGSGRVSAQEGQRMQQQPDWEAARKLGERKSGSPDLPGPRSPDDPPIPPLTSTVPPYKGDQRWQQQQSNCRKTFDEGTTRFSSSTNMPQQATPSYGSQDDYDIPLKVHLPKDGKHMTSVVDQTVEEIRRPFQDMNLGSQQRHLPEQCSIVRCFKAVLAACPQCHNYLCREHIEGFCPCGSKRTSNNSSYSGNTQATDLRLQLLIDKLDPDELKKLYNHLDMSARDVHKAELAARSLDPDLMALSVLRKWRQKKGRSATCEVILEALLLCKCEGAKEELVDEWQLRDYSDQGAESGGMPSNPRPRKEGLYGDTSSRRQGLYGDTSPRRDWPYGDTSPVKICRPESVGAMPVQEKYQGAGKMLVSSSSTSNLYQDMNRGPRRNHSPQRALTVPQVRPRSLSPNFRRPTSDGGKDRAITEQDICRIDKYIGKKYRDLGRQLGLTEVEINVIEADHKGFGVKEFAHQVLLKWINKYGRRLATKSVLTRALWNVELANLCDQILV